MSDSHVVVVVVLAWYSHLATWLLQLQLVFCSVACLLLDCLFCLFSTEFLAREGDTFLHWSGLNFEAVFSCQRTIFLPLPRTTSRQIPLAWLLQGEPSSCDRCNATFEIENSPKAHIRRKHFFGIRKGQSTKLLAWLGWASPLHPAFFGPQDQLFQPLQCNFW